MGLDIEKKPNPSHLAIHVNYKYTCHLHDTFYTTKLLTTYLII